MLITPRLAVGLPPRKRPRSRGPPIRPPPEAAPSRQLRLRGTRLRDNLLTSRPLLLQSSTDPPPSRRHASEAVARPCMGDGPDSAHRGGRGVALAGLLRRRRRKSPMGSRRVPIEFRRPRTCPRQESGFRGADPAPPDTGRNSRETEWGLSRNRDPSGSSRMGTEWGLGPFTIEQTTEDVTAIHRLAASRLRGRRLSPHRPPAREPSGDPRERRRHGS
jgi:hypothetical protein